LHTHVRHFLETELERKNLRYLSVGIVKTVSQCIGTGEHYRAVLIRRVALITDTR